MTTLVLPNDMATTAEWTPPKHEFRPSSLGACPQYANFHIHDEEDEVLDVGRHVMFATGHAAEAAWIEYVREYYGWNICHGVELDNGFGGSCHPDGVDWTTRTIYEIKFTNHSKIQPYYRAQLSWYLMRMANETLRYDWTGKVVLINKFGKEPQLLDVPMPDPDYQWELHKRALMQRGELPARRLCESSEQALTKAKYYDFESPCGSRTEIACPYAARCFPELEDGFE